MNQLTRIEGGAGPFEAAVVAAVVNEVLRTEQQARQSPPQPTNRPPAWVRALQPRNLEDPLVVVVPDHRGDPL